MIRENLTKFLASLVIIFTVLIYLLSILNKSFDKDLAAFPYSTKFFYTSSVQKIDNLDFLTHLSYLNDVPPKITASKVFHYLKFNLSNTTNSNREVLVKFLAPMRELTVWAKSKTGVIKKESGLLRNYAEADIQSKDYIFRYQLPPNDSTEFYVRAHSNFPLTIQPTLLQETDYIYFDHFMQLFVGIYMGMVSVVSFINLIIFVWTLEKIYLSYTTFMIFSHLFGVLGIYGIMNELLLSQYPELAEKSILVGLGVGLASAMWFAKIFLNLSSQFKKIARAFDILISLTILASIIACFHVSPTLADTMDLLSALTLVLTVFASLRCLLKRNRSSIIFALAYYSFVCGGIIFILQDNGIIPTSHFTQYSLLIGCLFECLVFTLALALRFYGIRSEAQRHKGELSEIVNSGEKKESLEFFENKTIVPKEIELSIMFIDVVGFSNTALRLSPKKLFEEHVNQIHLLKSIIRKFGGVIGGTGGDSILCYFGYDIVRKLPNNDHPDVALNCAITIQRSICESFDQKSLDKKAIFPLRIGIESATTLIGDMGDRWKSDITAIGSSINFVRRLEEACSPLKILIGPSLYSKLKQSRQDILLSKKYLYVKHNTQLQEGYEVSPYSETEHMRKLMRIILDYEEKAQGEARTKVPSDQELNVKTDVGTFRILDISHSGFLLNHPNLYLANNVCFRIEQFELRGEVLPVNSMLLPFMVHVRWGENSPNGFLHGVRIESLNEINREFLFDLLCDYLGLEKTDKKAA